MPGTLEHLGEFSSQYLSARPVDVWLPPDYYQDASRRYPVIYMHDGQNLFDPSLAFGGTCWEVDEALVELIHTGKAPPAVLVGIWNTMDRWLEYVPERPLELEHGRAVRQWIRENFGGDPNSDAYLRFIVNELKPFIDQHYRTVPGQISTSLMGSSMGGLISLYGVIEYPQVFGAAACLSTHWPYGNGIMLDFMSRALPRPGNHRFYFDFGTETLDATYEPYQQQADKIMRKFGYTPNSNWITRKFPGADHSEVAWRERVHIPLTFLLNLEQSRD